MALLNNPFIKRTFTRLGMKLPRTALHLVLAATNYIAVGYWVRQKAFDILFVQSREDVYETIANDIHDETVLYLEFGVWKGASMRKWVKLLASPTAIFHGFDSFEGLPSSWNISATAGHFSTGGRAPHIADTRVTFFPGRFEHTLPHYQAPEHDVLIINLDADLYSSTKYVLDHFESLLVPGTYLYFDEFSDRDHELRAFDEFLTRTGLTVRPVCATRELSRIAFKVV